MILVGLLALAFAGEPGDPRDRPVSEGAPLTVAELEDIERWATRGRAMLDGPPGCIEVQGTARLRVAVFRPGGLWGPGERRDIESRGTFSGTLDHGVWTHLDAALETDDGRDEIEIDTVHPMMGRHQLEQGEPDEPQGSITVGTSGSGTTVAIESGGAQALSMIDLLIEEIDPSITTTYTAWDSTRRAVVLEQLVVMGDGRNTQEAEVRTLFPEAGPPTALDLVLPKRLGFTEGPLRIRVLNAQVHLRAQPTALGLVPAQDATSLVVGVLGFTLGLEQHLTYSRVRACPQEP